MSELLGVCRSDAARRRPPVRSGEVGSSIFQGCPQDSRVARCEQFRQGVIDDLEAIVDEQPDPGVPFVNLRMAEVPLLVDPGSRCLVPFTGWDQRRRSGSDEVIRFDLPAGDIGFFAGVHQSGWRGIHRHDDGVENLNLFAIVCFERLAPTAEPGRKLTPIILSRQYQQEQWMSATWGETFKLVGALTSSRAENPSQETLG